MTLLLSMDAFIHYSIYRIQPNYRPCPHYPPPPPPTFSLTIADSTIFFLTVYLIFTYYRPLDDLLALVKDNKFPALTRSNTVPVFHYVIGLMFHLLSNSISSSITDVLYTAQKSFHVMTLYKVI